MTLKDGKDNTFYKVLDFDLDINLQRRLQALGLTIGSNTLVVNNAKKGAMTVKIRGTRFALGKKIAKNIIVEEGTHARDEISGK